MKEGIRIGNALPVAALGLSGVFALDQSRPNLSDAGTAALADTKLSVGVGHMCCGNCKTGATAGLSKVAGDITIDQNRNASKSIVVIEIKGGKFTYRTSIQPK